MSTGRRRRLVLALALTLLLPFFNAKAVHCAVYEFDMGNESSDSGDYGGIASDFFSALPDDATEDLPGDILSDEGARRFDFGYFVNRISDALSEAFPDVVGGFIPMMAALMISALAGSAYPLPGEKGVWRICSGAVSAWLICSVQIGIISVAERFLSVTSEVVTAVAPAVTVLYASTGNITASAVGVSGMLTSISVISQIFSKVICPAAKLSFCLSVIGASAGAERIYALSALIRKAATWILTIVMTVITFALPVQTVLAHSADSFGAAAAKFAAGSFIPVVGGAVSEAVTTVTASFSAIKNACGAAGIVVMLIMLIPPAAVLILNRLMLTVCSCTAELFGCDTEKKLLDESGGVCTLFIAVCLSAALMFIFSMALLVKTGTVLGGG